MGDLAVQRGRGPALTSRHFLALVRTRGKDGRRDSQATRVGLAPRCQVAPGGRLQI